MLIGYARVSTDDQRLDLQRDALTAAGVETVRLYEEHASGSTSERPALTECLRSLRRGDTLVVWRLDRLGRSLRDLIAISERLEAEGVGLRSLSESIDTSTAGGRMVFHVFGAVAQFERDLIRERTQAGLQAARARGRRGGRPSKIDSRKLKAAKAMLSDPTMTHSEVAAELRVSRATLYRALARDRQAAA